MQGKMRSSRHPGTRKNGLELFPRFQSLHRKMKNQPRAVAEKRVSDRQAFATFGTPCIDDCTTTTGFHADQEAMGTGPANFGRLVGALHFQILRRLDIWVTRDYRQFFQYRQDLMALTTCNTSAVQR
jgi:hypothetical protein